MASVPNTGVDLAQLPTTAQRRKMNVLVVSSVALAFISFWQAAAIVLCDLASSAYYVGGISEQAIGKAAPWFILAVMLFSYAVRSVYVESCTMFTRGGVYRVVKEAMGGSLAKLSVSALMFDYVLTGPISAVTAGQYLVGWFIDVLNLLGRHVLHNYVPIDHTTNDTQHIVAVLSVVIAILITIYFWRLNIIGISESSDKALKIMKLTTLMGVLIIAWSFLTLLLKPHGMTIAKPPLAPVFTDESLGWLAGMRIIGPIGCIIAFGHSILAMSGEETLAQVNREIAAPKLKNLLRTGFVIFLYSLLLTGLVSFLAVLIIPDGKRVATYIVPSGQERKAETPQVDYLRPTDTPGQYWGYRLDNADPEHPRPTRQKLVAGKDTNSGIERADGGYRDNLINGLAHYLIGPGWMKILMQALVSIVGFLILAGAVNTSIVGSNGVMNRLAEDGVLTPWFLHPQKRFGTTHRLINLIAILQVGTILASFGDVNTLGEAYAFGVIWSFVFKTLAMVVLRFRDKSPRHYEVPFNIRIRRRPNTGAAPDVLAAPLAAGAPSMSVPADGDAPKPALVRDASAARQIDLPIGISLIFLILLSTSVMNLLTKKTATRWGIGFTIVFLAVFVICELISRRRHKGRHEHLEQFNEHQSDRISAEALGLTHPDPILVAVRGPKSLPVLGRILQEIDTTNRDVVVLTCKVLPALTPGVTARDTAVDDSDRELLTKVITVTEEVGKEVHAMVLPTNNPLYGIACAARDLKAREVVLGVSETLQAETQLEQFAMAWGSATAEIKTPPLRVRIVGPQVEIKYEME